MASAACGSWWARSYIGGWSAWTDDFTNAISDGYCYDENSDITYAYCFYFKTPAVSKFYKSTSLNITIPIIRTSSSFSKSGTLYFKLLKSDPTGNSISSNFKPGYKVTADASCDWTSSDQQVHKVSFTIYNDSLQPNTEYYITVRGSRLIGIGYKRYTPSNGWWQATFNYKTYTDVTANTPTITDNKNNTFTISAKAGVPGANNAVKRTTLKYSIDAVNWFDAPDLTLHADIKWCPAAVESQSIYAHTFVDGTYSDATSNIAGAIIKNYRAPIWQTDAKVELHESSFKNRRLVIKQDWGWNWTLANQANNSSPVKYYRIRCLIKRKGTDSFVNTPIINYWDKTTKLSKQLNQGDWVYDRDATYGLPMPMAAGDFEEDLKPGDKIKLSVQAYSVNGLGEALLTSEITSSEYTVENAGVVNVKVNTGTTATPVYEWVEGQVWVKVNDAWTEAETVSVKVDGNWVESQ